MKQNQNFADTIKSNMFMKTDKVEMELVLQTMVSTDVCEETLFEKDADVILKFKDMLMTGASWEFNPVNSNFYDDRNGFVIIEEKLREFMTEEALVTLEPLDINNNFVEIRLPVILLIGNAADLSDEIIKKSEYCTIHTMIGEIDL